MKTSACRKTRSAWNSSALPDREDRTSTRWPRRSSCSSTSAGRHPCRKRSSAGCWSLGGKRVSKEGVLAIDARRFRTQDANRRDALERLLRLVRQAAAAPKPRRPTRPGAAAKARRLNEKKKRGTVKLARKKTVPEME